MATPEPSREDIFQPGGLLHQQYLSEPAAEVLRQSLRLARETRWDSLRSPHIFMGLLAVGDPGVRMWCDRLGADLTNLLGQFQELFHQEEGEREALLMLNREFFSDNVIKLLRDAHTRAIDNGRTFVTPMDLLISLLIASNSIVAECFKNIGITATKLHELAVLAEHQAGQI